MPATPQMTIADCRGTEDAGRSGQTEVFEAAARATPSTLMIQEYDPGIPVPLHRRTRKKIWPQHFKKAVDKHDRLQDVAHNINYHPAMVGATPDDAKPSILVLCRQEDTSDLVSLFDDAFLARIRCASHSRPRLPSVISGTRTRTRDTRPDFWVYYYPSATDPTIRNAGSDVEFADVHLSSSITFCGALVEYNGRKATIGLTIEIDGMSRLLTVEHLFDEALPGTDTKSFEEDEAIWLYESDDSEDSREEFDDFGKGYNRPLDKRHSTTPELEALLRKNQRSKTLESLQATTVREPLACKANESKPLSSQVEKVPT
ncbi:hypothetical protein CTA2_5006 [Colletotrichum tanaceti]|uniref:Uncharacterized protein n=1 Tax=Colletotrichum tanaceti TaxID=1306861 RepID=A0A4U6XQX2_9PEZI|nr:hypothetical protein CTA2_5006 [Colletotrichum tanaceti]TKW58250.1 hypothetical protein CTA1_7605 [Colletotrichum tanaceti]